MPYAASPALTGLEVEAEHAVGVAGGHLVRHAAVVARVLVDGDHVQHRVADALILAHGDLLAGGAHEHGRVVVDVLDDDLRGDGGGEPRRLVLALVGGRDDDGVLGVHLVVDGVAQRQRARVLIDGEHRLRRLLADAVPEGRRAGGVSRLLDTGCGE